MAYSLTDKLVIGITSRALFDLEYENAIYDQQGVDAYAAHQRSNEDVPLNPGSAFPLVKALLELNGLLPGQTLIEVVVISRNSPDTGLRAFNAIEKHKLDITRAAFTGGSASISQYLHAFEVDLFLSKSQLDVQEAIDGGVAAAQLYELPAGYKSNTQQIRIAFDGDAVLFSADSEQYYKEHGLTKFLRRERFMKRTAMEKGPFAKLLLTLSELQKKFPPEQRPIRLAIVTARNSPAHARVIHTLREWGVSIDEAFFLGGVTKDKVLQAFGAHMFFDDQDTHVQAAATVVPAGKVPYEGGELGTRRGKKQKLAATHSEAHVSSSVKPSSSSDSATFEQETGAQAVHTDDQ
jgi:5'-nucleotidase